MDIKNQPTKEHIEDAAVLASLESGLINGLSCEDAKKALQGMDAGQLQNFVDSTCKKAAERK